MADNMETILGSIETSTESTSVSAGENTPETTPTAITGDPKSFLESLPEDMQKIPSLKSIKDVESLAKSYVHAQGLLGKKVEGMSPDEIKSIFGKAMQAPETVDEYNLDGTFEDPDIQDWWKKASFDLKLTTQQATELAKRKAEFDREKLTAAETLNNEKINTALETLKKDWGNQVDDKIQLAKKAVDNYGGKDLTNFLRESGLGNNPHVIKAFAKIGADMLESDMAGNSTVSSFTQTPEQARRTIAEKKMSKEFMEAYSNEMHPAHKDAVLDLQNLYAIAYN